MIGAISHGGTMFADPLSHPTSTAIATIEYRLR